MAERFLTIEECDKRIMDAELDITIWRTLKENIECGEFVMYDDETMQFSIIPKGMPLRPN